MIILNLLFVQKRVTKVIEKSWKKVEKSVDLIETLCYHWKRCLFKNERRKVIEKKLKNLQKSLDLSLIIWYITCALRKKEVAEKWSLKTEQNVNFKLGNKTDLKLIKIKFLRVWSWLRMNAGGMPKTCKSYEVALWNGVLAQSR